MILTGQGYLLITITDVLRNMLLITAGTLSINQLIVLSYMI